MLPERPRAPSKRRPIDPTTSRTRILPEGQLEGMRARTSELDLMDLSRHALDEVVHSRKKDLQGRRRVCLVIADHKVDRWRFASYRATYDGPRQEILGL